MTSGVTAIAAGYFETCAALSGGGVKCWGRNDHGQLGNGTTTDSSVPVSVTNLTSAITALAMGETHTCAVTSGGGALCWGWNESGALGNGSTVQSSTPVAVVGLTHGVTAVAVGQVTPVPSQAEARSSVGGSRKNSATGQWGSIATRRSR